MTGAELTDPKEKQAGRFEAHGQGEHMRVDWWTGVQYGHKKAIANLQGGPRTQGERKKKRSLVDRI